MQIQGRLGIPLIKRKNMFTPSKRALLPANGIIFAAIVGFVSMEPAPRLNGGQQQADAPAANKTVAELVSQVSHGIALVEAMREYNGKNAQTGKAFSGWTSE